MALDLAGFPDINPAKNYQCGVVAVAFPACIDDCRKCVTRLGPIFNLVPVLDRYRDLTIRQGRGELNALFDPNYEPFPRWTRIKDSLDLSYPVIAGISPDRVPADPADSQHTILITGYDDDYRGTGEEWVILKDPYPYPRDSNPYAAAGYHYEESSRKAELPWRVLRERLNLTSAVFLVTRGA